MPLNMKSIVPPKHYRSDIDGLRALAVLLVVTYHYFQVSGGYIGVDIFFVISGYLISQQIFRDLEKNTFSLSEFYAKRIRRILPPLVLMVVMTLAAGWFLLLPTDFMSLGKHAAAGIAYVSNLLLWTESGYFDAPSAHKPFLHLWSLGIEEQFYLTWPLALILITRLRGAMLPILIGLTLASFVVNLILTAQGHSAAFYMPVTRFWELSAGGILAYCGLYHQQGVQRWLGGAKLTLWLTRYSCQLGVLLIACVVLLVDKKSAYPGYWALMPVLGTSLILVSSPRTSFQRRLFENRVAVWLGQISYGLYLWHWPVLVLMYLSDMTSSMSKFIALGLSVSLAYATYQLVELPVRSIPVTRTSSWRFIIAGVSATVMIGTTGLLFANGNIHRSWDAALISQPYQDPVNGCMADGSGVVAIHSEAIALCETIKHPGQPVVMLLGDSHAYGLYQGLEPYLDAHHVNLISLPIMYCTPLSVQDKRLACNTYNTWLKHEIRDKQPDLVMIFAHHLLWSDDEGYGESQPYPAYLWEQARLLKQAGVKQVMVVGQIPTWFDALPHNLNLHFLRKGLDVPSRTWTGIAQDSLKMDEVMRAAQPSTDIPYVSLRDALCNAEGCLTKFGNQYPQDLIVHDYGHLTQRGARYLSEHILGEQILALLPVTP